MVSTCQAAHNCSAIRSTRYFGVFYKLEEVPNLAGQIADRVLGCLGEATCGRAAMTLDADADIVDEDVDNVADALVRAAERAGIEDVLE